MKKILKVSQIVFDSITDIKKSLALDAEEGHWITVKGTHIKISEGGKIVAGPKELKQALEHHSDQSKHHEKKMLEKSSSGKHEEARAHQEASNNHKQAGSHLSQAITLGSQGEKTLSSGHASLAEKHSKQASQAEQSIAANKSKSGKEEHYLPKTESESSSTSEDPQKALHQKMWNRWKSLGKLSKEELISILADRSTQT